MPSDLAQSRWLAGDSSMMYMAASRLVRDAGSPRSSIESTKDSRVGKSEVTTANYNQNGDHNTQINADTYNDNSTSTSVTQQHVSGSIKLDNAHIQQVIQNRFSGPISVRTASIAGTSSIFTAFSAATDLQRTAVEVQGRLRDLPQAHSEDSDIYIGLSSFQSLLQKLCDSFANPSQEHRRDLLTLQDYFVVLIQAQRLLSRIDKDIDNGLSLSGEDTLHAIRRIHLPSLNMLNSQLSDQVDVLTTASYAVAQATATKVMQVGDQSALECYDVLSNINRQVEQAQKMLRSITDQSAQPKDALKRTSALSSRPEYEEALRNSPAYARYSLNYRSSARFSMSTRASSARSEAWPALDLVSLANVSIISVIGLPVSWDNPDTPFEELPAIVEEAEDGSDVSKTTQRSLTQRVRDVTGYAAMLPRQNLFNAVDEGNEDLVKRLLDAGVSIDYVHPIWRRTPLVQAVHKGNLRMVQMVLAARPLIVNDHPRPLCMAVKRNHALMVQELLTYKLIDVNCYDDNEASALRLAVTMDHPEIVAILLMQSNLVVNRINVSNQTPLEVAVKKGSWQIVKLLAEDDRTDVNGAKFNETALNSAIQENNLAIVEILLSVDRVDANIKDSQGRLPLAAAISCGHIAIAKALVASGKTIFIDPYTSSDNSPLRMAVRYWDTEMIEILLDQAGHRMIWAIRVVVEHAEDSDINTSLAKKIADHIDIESTILIDIVVRRGLVSIFRELLDKGIFDWRETALESSRIAKNYGHKEMVEAIYERALIVNDKMPRAL